MAKKIYRNGKYTGEEILSEQEHKERRISAFRNAAYERARYIEKYEERKRRRKKFYKNWHNTNWLWFLLLFCWPLGCYGIYKRYFKKKS